jgi:hypothetical protein
LNQLKISNEQAKFVQCEKLFHDDMVKLCTAVEVQNEKESLRLLECIEKNVDEIIPSFVHESNIGILLKNVRYVFEHIKPDEIVRTKAMALTRALKDIYEKKSQNAVQFTPKRSKDWKLKTIADVSRVASNAVADKTSPSKTIADALITTMKTSKEQLDLYKSQQTANDSMEKVNNSQEKRNDAESDYFTAMAAKVKVDALKANEDLKDRKLQRIVFALEKPHLLPPGKEEEIKIEYAKLVME